MKETELKFRLETGRNAKESKFIAVTPEVTQEQLVYTDDYIEWLESKAEINTKAIDVLTDFVRLSDHFGLYLGYLVETYKDAKKLLKHLKMIPQ